MKTKSAVTAATLALCLTSAAFAAPRSYDSGRRDARNDRAQQSSRYDNQRVTYSGRIASLTPARDGYSVRLEGRNDAFFIPQSRLGGRARDFRVGVSIELGGIFRGGRVDVDAINWPGNYGRDTRGYRDEFVSGIVDRVDVRSDAILLRDSATGRTIDVDMRDTNGRIDARDLRRGDYVRLSGEWLRGNTFAAYAVDSVDSRR